TACGDGSERQAAGKGPTPGGTRGARHWIVPSGVPLPLRQEVEREIANGSQPAQEGREGEPRSSFAAQQRGESAREAEDGGGGPADEELADSGQPFSGRPVEVRPLGGAKGQQQAGEEEDPRRDGEARWGTLGRRRVGGVRGHCEAHERCNSNRR